MKDTEHLSRQGEPVSKNALYHHVPRRGCDFKVPQVGEQVIREGGRPNIGYLLGCFHKQTYNAFLWAANNFAVTSVQLKQAQMAGQMYTLNRPRYLVKCTVQDQNMFSSSMIHLTVVLDLFSIQKMGVVFSMHFKSHTPLTSASLPHKMRLCQCHCNDIQWTAMDS